jgi:hypothetical protein
VRFRTGGVRSSNWPSTVLRGEAAGTGEALERIIVTTGTRASVAAVVLLLTLVGCAPGTPDEDSGYDRDGKQGPWLLNRLVRWIHRHSGYVPMSDVVNVDWDGRRVLVTGPLRPLDHS